MTLLYHDKPWSVGAENVLKRAKQLMDIEWTPVKPLPNSFKFVGPEGKYYYNAHFSRWLPQKGVPYSSCRMVEKYVGWNISIETFLSALKNPNSVVYTRELKDQPGVGCNCYYGLVCSMYVSYALQLPYRYACAFWTPLPTVHPVDMSSFDNIRLCDIVLDPTRHIGIVTDIERDVDGHIHYIEVCESVMPISTRTRFTAEEFRHYWLEDGYSMYRYDLVDEVTYEPDPFVYVEGDPIVPRPEINTALMLDFGNKANYRIGDEPVEISVFEEGWEQIEVTTPSGEKELYPITEGKLVLNPTVPGFYSACLYQDGRRSADIQWCMVNINVAFGKEKYAVGEPLDITFASDAPEDTVFHYVLNSDTYYVKDNYFFTDEEKAAGRGFAPGVAAPGKYYIIVLAKNKYGIYTSPYTELIVE